MKRKNKRLSFVVLTLLALAAAAGLVLAAFEDNIVFFHSPTEIVKKNIRPEQRLRVGGLVEEGTVKQTGQDAITSFRVTDLTTSLTVNFKGILPDLSGKARVWLRRAITETVFLKQRKFSPNTMRHTCQKKWRTR